MTEHRQRGKSASAHGVAVAGRNDSETRPAIATRVEMVLPGLSIDRSVAMGVAWGVVAWSAYALVEYLLCSVVPLLSAERAVFTPLNWTLTAWLFNAYWIIGALAGGLCGTLAARLSATTSDRAREDRLRFAVIFSLLVAVLLTILTAPRLQYGARTVLAVDIALLSVSVWVLVQPGSRLAPWVRIPPLLLVTFIQLPVWLGAEVFGRSGSLLRRSVMILASGAILAAGYYLKRFRDWSPTRHLSVNLALLMVVVVASAVISGRNRAIPAPPSQLGADPGTPPVILVSFDTTRADHLSVYGYPRKTTPHLEQLSRQATVYTNAVAASDWTLPSHASMFTGVYPSWHRARSFGVNPNVLQPLDETFPTLASILKDRGVFTVGVAANKAFLPPEWGMGRGFQSYNVQAPVEVLSQVYTYNLRQGIRRLLSCCIDTGSFDTQYRPAVEVNGDVISAVEDRAVRDRSFFLFVNYMDAHTPFVAPVPKGVSLPSGRGAPHFQEHMQFAEDVLYGHAPYPQSALSLTVERYDAGIAAEDEGLGEIIGWLKRRGLFDRALIIVTADHGEAFGEHNMAAHGISTYQDQVHVPMIIKFPGQSQPRQVADLVSHVDILPTVLATLGIPSPSHVQGVSLLDDRGLSGRTVFAESFPSRPGRPPIPRFDRTERAVRVGGYKLIVSDKGKHELFDLSQDPLELHNLTARNLAEAQPIEEALRKWIGLIPVQTKRTRLQNQQQMDRLRGLGYVH